MAVADHTISIPRTVWVLGFVSLSMDLSSELIHSLLPIFMVSTLGISMLTLGVIEGIAEATALIAKVFSGMVSDLIRRRKVLLLLGYGLAALTKPLFPMAHSADTVFTARFLDRIGKGIRGAPRDALVADVAPPAIRGTCFGLRQSMDTVGAVLGPLLAILLLYWLNSDIQRVLWFAVLPAAAAVLLLCLGLREAAPSGPPAAHRFPIRRALLRRLAPAYWYVVALGAVFTLARFSEAFLILRAQQLGLPTLWIPLVMVVMSLLYTVSAYPAGWLSDRFSRMALLGISLVLLIGADLVLARAAATPTLMAGVALRGLHMGFSQGLLAALVADSAPAELKGTAFGLFNLVSGLAMLCASVIAGWLWQAHGSVATFYVGAVFAGLSLLALLFRPMPAR
ncbi:MFS transporter [Crenobacter sp. SG2305]|uniref:MFS transporter n=1 Tax=Crenobacter oryzisoli TaxID=3056844 RepID=UPI0025AA75C1|nr:MFS transporter [Crenobacter sp. SG2305]MDN0085248.1 MFS transporter [Crenobacter sp. SG2305]